MVRVRLRGRYEQLLTGELSVEDLDDEELARGQLKSADGSWRGRPPMVIPAQLVSAMRRELFKRAEDNLRSALMGGGIKTLVDLAENSLDESVRLRAANAIIERTMGKVPDKVQLSTEDPVEKLFRDLLSDPKGLDGEPPERELTAEERELL